MAPDSCMSERAYMAIDLKSFYASVECADRGLDPFTTDLVVADPTRSPNTICLAITPSLKAKGVRNRCRIREIPQGIPYITAMPRMHRYMEVSAQVYAIYLRYVSSQDAWPYSVDEAFLDVTSYQALYGLDVRALARRIITAVREETGVSATAGIGPNMFLCKVALDLMAKHAADGIGQLDEKTFRRNVWFHHPITDIWGIGPGIARRLARADVHDLAGICATDPTWLRGEFGRNAEWLIDHAWGLEPCTIADARNYVPKAHSLSNGQVLMRDYGFDEARIVLREMAWQSHTPCVPVVRRRCPGSRGGAHALRRPNGRRAGGAAGRRGHPRAATLWAQHRVFRHEPPSRRQRPRAEPADWRASCVRTYFAR